MSAPIAAKRRVIRSNERTWTLLHATSHQSCATHNRNKKMSIQIQTQNKQEATDSQNRQEWWICDVPYNIMCDQIRRVPEMGDEVEVPGVARERHLDDVEDPARHVDEVDD